MAKMIKVESCGDCNNLYNSSTNDSYCSNLTKKVNQDVIDKDCPLENYPGSFKIAWVCGCGSQWFRKYNEERDQCTKCGTTYVARKVI